MDEPLPIASREIDALTAPSLKHVRDRWWDETFTAFLARHLDLDAATMILDVGSGAGTAELQLGLLHHVGARLVGVDASLGRVHEALRATRAHGLTAAFLAADATALPFADDSFHATFAVAVLQHLRDPGSGVRECARVTRPGGRVLLVEPDYAARYWYSSLESGREADDASRRLFARLVDARGDRTDSALGPWVPTLAIETGLEPLAVELLPVSVVHCGSPTSTWWDARRSAARALVGTAPESLRDDAEAYLAVIDRYAADALRHDEPFVELQFTMLFATLAQKPAR